MAKVSGKYASMVAANIGLGENCISVLIWQHRNELTGNKEDDANVGTSMIKGKTGKVNIFKGDGVYDKFGFRKTLGLEIIQVIPPSKNAVIPKDKNLNNLSHFQPLKSSVSNKTPA